MKILGGTGADTFHRDANPSISAQERVLYDFNPAEGDQDV